MNELHSAYGLVQPKHIDEFISRLKELAELYRKEFLDIKGIRILYDIEGVEPFIYLFFFACG